MPGFRCTLRCCRPLPYARASRLLAFREHLCLKACATGPLRRHSPPYQQTSFFCSPFLLPIFCIAPWRQPCIHMAAYPRARPRASNPLVRIFVHVYMMNIDSECCRFLPSYLPAIYHTISLKSKFDQLRPGGKHSSRFYSHSPPNTLSGWPVGLSSSLILAISSHSPLSRSITCSEKFLLADNSSNRHFS